MKANTAWTIEILFDLLDVAFDKSGKESSGACPVFSILGLQVDLFRTGEWQVLAGHTDKRKEELLFVSN